MMLMWYNDFVDLIQDQHNNIYNSACKYADIKENYNNIKDNIK